MRGKQIALVITGIIAGIITLCVLLAIFVGVPVKKNKKYNNAIHNAEAGNYTVAINELNGINDYKDVPVKKQEYAIEAAKQCIEDDDTVNALSLLNYAMSIDADSKLTKEAKALFDKIHK